MAGRQGNRQKGRRQIARATTRQTKVPAPTRRSTRRQTVQNSNSIAGQETADDKEKKIPCTHFGTDREIKFPRHFFCKGCSLYDQRLLFTNWRRIKQDSQRFCCTADHRSRTFPTQLKKEWCLMKPHGTGGPSEDRRPVALSDDSSCEEGEDSDGHGDDDPEGGIGTNGRRSTTNNEHVAFESTLRHVSHRNLLRQKRKVELENQNLRTAVKDLSQSLQEARTRIGQYEAASLPFRTGPNDAEKEYGIRPESILEALDLSPICSLQAVDLLRSIETNKEKYVHNTFIPSQTSILRAARIVEEYAERVVPVTTGVLPPEVGNGEYILLEPKAAVKQLVRGFGLDDVAKQRSIQIAQSQDGTRLTEGTGGKTANSLVLKVQDKEAIDPIKGTPLYSVDPKASKIQSNSLIVPVMVTIGPETKEMVQQFSEVYHQTGHEMSLFEEEHPFSSLLGSPYKPIRFSYPSDMKHSWNSLGRGGPMKVANYACHCCNIEKNQIHCANDTECDRFCAEWRTRDDFHLLSQDFECHHHEWLSTTSLRVSKARLDELLVEHKLALEEVHEIAKHSSFDVKEMGMPAGNGSTDPTSIYFVLEGASVADRYEHSQLITLDMELRGLQFSASDSLAARRLILMERMLLEYRLLSLESKVKNGSFGSEESLFLMENNVPCVLHLENRVIEKVINTIIKIGWENAGQEITYSDLPNSTPSSRQAKFKDDIERIINTQAFGTDEFPTQWKLSLDKNKSPPEPENVSFTNDRCRKVLAKIDQVIEVSIDDQRDVWIRCAANLQKLLGILSQREDFTDAAILDFQFLADLFYKDWLRLAGRSGITNYIHMIGSGHLADYMYRWRNLYMHSNQGFEAWNKLLKRYYQTRTRHGGGNRGICSHLLPLAKWMQRRLMWISGVTFDEMKSKVEEWRASDNDSLDNDYVTTLAIGDEIVELNEDGNVGNSSTTTVEPDIDNNVTLPPFLEMAQNPFAISGSV